MNTLNKSTVITVIITLLIGIGLGWLFFGNSSSSDHQHDHVTETKNQTWTCSMHPQIRQPEFGKCPICGMDLITIGDEETTTGSLEIKMSPTAMQLANVRTSIIKKERPVKEVRLNGKVQADERYVFSQTSHISGRIEKLLVSYTGEYVTKGQVIAYIYSPELVTAQEELFEAFKIRASQPSLFKAAKEKLKNWKLTETQINGILESGIPAENFPILSDLTGIVISKRINLGDHIMQGSSLFEVANLSHVWVLFDVYESDIQWVNKNDKMEFNIQSLPGEKFKGTISFIDPVINPKTRVAKARVAINNPGQRLKPEMFATGVLKSPFKDSEEAIIVPKSAIMWTGERSVVYVKTSNGEGINFMMREVILGPALGNDYIVSEGLKEGEELATHGTFSIDAAAQLAGKPSMMNPTAGMVMASGKDISIDKINLSEVKHIKISKETKRALSPLFESYMKLKDYLVSDDFDNANASAKNFRREINKVQMSLFKGNAHDTWMEMSNKSKEVINSFIKSKDISEARNEFINLSNQMIRIAQTFIPNEKTMYVQFCPMANNDKGANWLSMNKEVRNPYFGASMLTCGSVENEIK